MHVADLLAQRIDEVRSPVCVGLDPVLDRLPEAVLTDAIGEVEPIERFCSGVIDAVRESAAAVKLQSACFERFGAEGIAALERLGVQARDAGLFVVLDAKRGDIGLTMEHYAEAVERTGAHAVTASGYLGVGALLPLLERGVMVFVLVRTSNPEGDALQTAQIEGGGRVCELLGAEVAKIGAERRGERGLSQLGAVVGATKGAEGASLREWMPDQVFLVPGYGAQGGSAEAVRRMARPGAKAAQAGVLVTASRSVIYAQRREGEGWQEAVRRAAGEMACELAGVLA